MSDRFFARSASDRTDDWLFWFVADRNRGGLNVTADLVRQHINGDHGGQTLTTKECAVRLAGIANAAEAQQ